MQPIENLSLLKKLPKDEIQKWYNNPLTKVLLRTMLKEMEYDLTDPALTHSQELAKRKVNYVIKHFQDSVPNKDLTISD